MLSPKATLATRCTETLPIPALMDRLKSLRVLRAIARQGTTVSAARALHITQPAVTRSLLDLEKKIGQSLFDRATRGMIATPLGHSLASRADMLFSHLLQGAHDAIAAAPADARGTALPERFPDVVTSASLRALIAIAATGSEATAAAWAQVTQPAVHAALQSLERVVGVHLFYKTASGTRLTPSGEALLRRVKLAAAEARAMESDIAAADGDARGRIVVGVLPLSVVMFLPLAVENLLAHHPNIEVQIVDGTYESLMQQLLHADIDAIAGALRNDAAKQEVHQVSLFDDELVVVARSDHPCARLGSLTLHDLQRWQWVMPLPATPAERLMAQVFQEHGLDLPVATLRAGSPALTIAFVLQTGRLAFTSRGQARLEDHGGRLTILPLDLSSLVRRIGLVTRSVGKPSHDLQMFVSACQATALSQAQTQGHQPIS